MIQANLIYRNVILTKDMKIYNKDGHRILNLGYMMISLSLALPPGATQRILHGALPAQTFWKNMVLWNQVLEI